MPPTSQAPTLAQSPAAPRRADEPLVLAVPAAAAVLGIGRSKAYELIRRGELPHVKLGRRTLIPRAALDDFLARVSAV